MTAANGRPAQFSTRGAFLVAGLAMSSLAPQVPLVKARLGIQEHTLGLLLLCVGIGSVMVMPFAGGLAGRFGCRRVIVTAALILCAALPVLATGGSLPVLAAALFVFGAAGGTLDVTMNVQAVMVEEASGRAMMSGFHGLFSVGALFGAGGMTLLMSNGVSPVIAQMVIVGACLLLIAASAPYLLSYGSSGDAPPFALPHGRVLALGVLCFVLFMAEGSVGDWSGVFMVEAHHLPVTQSAYGYVAFMGMMTLNRLLGDPIVAFLGPQRMVFLGSLLAAFGFLGAAFSPWWGFSIVGFGIAGIGVANVVPVLFSAAGRQSAMPANLAVSAVTTMGYAGFLLGPPGIGRIAHDASLSLAFALLALLLGIVSLSSRIVPR
ncbi:MFS transporter [soil metagenome]